ncbi:hypothetical protein [Caballeronia sp. ATUFL_F1_KS39]|uniref:hypothetical protein n=1 Tax=Caballeronia sp. ATUFL_F1_KS39 TaxID=2921766 RepID=UPI0020284967|nr:hypothetical protein [Caballeronia sp. ATUFL_F1_KS39]
MSTFARIAANRLRDMQYPLTENERLQYATLHGRWALSRVPATDGDDHGRRVYCRR